jgi:hypothetical protein
MKGFISQLKILILFSFCISSTSIDAQPLPVNSTMHVGIHFSDKISVHFEKYLLFAYMQIGYEVSFEKILTARAREMVNAGKLDAIIIAEKEIDKVYKNLLRIPVMLARGALMLYCNKQVTCDTSVLTDSKNVVGVVSGSSMSANYMRKMSATTYGVINQEVLGLMLTKERLNYVLIINEERLGNLGNFDETPYNKIEVHRSEGYHFIHNKHANILPELTKALHLAIENFGPLVEQKLNN